MINDKILASIINGKVVNQKPASRISINEGPVDITQALGEIIAKDKTQFRSKVKSLLIESQLNEFVTLSRQQWDTAEDVYDKVNQGKMSEDEAVKILMKEIGVSKETAIKFLKDEDGELEEDLDIHIDGKDVVVSDPEGDENIKVEKGSEEIKEEDDDAVNKAIDGIINALDDGKVSEDEAADKLADLGLEDKEIDEILAEPEVNESKRFSKLKKLMRESLMLETGEVGQSVKIIGGKAGKIARVNQNAITVKFDNGDEMVVDPSDLEYMSESSDKEFDEYGDWEKEAKNKGCDVFATGAADGKYQAKKDDIVKGEFDKNKGSGYLTEAGGFFDLSKNKDWFYAQVKESTKLVDVLQRKMNEILDYANRFDWSNLDKSQQKQIFNRLTETENAVDSLYGRLEKMLDSFPSVSRV